MQAQLHYLYDPLCGWCYAAAPLLEAVRRQYPALPVQLHGGGLFSRQRITPELAAHIRRHDARIHQLSGQPFGPDYLQGLLAARDVQLDSATVIGAILAVERLRPALAIPMLQAIHRAHYQQGRRVVERGVLTELAGSLGLSAQAFERALEALAGEPTQQHIAATRRRMAEVGAQGFPTFVLQRGTALTILEHGACYGHPQAFADAISLSCERMTGTGEGDEGQGGEGQGGEGQGGEG